MKTLLLKRSCIKTQRNGLTFSDLIANVGNSSVKENMVLEVL